MICTTEELSMLLSEACAGWPTGEIDDAITCDMDDAMCEALFEALFPPDGFTFADPDLILAMLTERGARVNAAAILTSNESDWQTPPEIVDLIAAFNGEEIDLDPCGAPGNPTRAAANWYPPKADGLAQEWATTGLVYVNPPYRDTPKWVAKLLAERERETGLEVLLLAPPRTETRWFREVAASADAVAFWHGWDGGEAPPEVSDETCAALRRSRISFVDPAGAGRCSQNTTASMFAYWGRRGNRFRRFFERFAWVVQP